MVVFLLNTPLNTQCHATQKGASVNVGEPTETNVEEAAVTNDKKVYCCAYDGFVNIRQEPSYSAEKVGKFFNGPEGAVWVEDCGEWVKINILGTIGYVPAKYVQDKPTIAYTGKASASWIEGIWSNNSGFMLMIYNNGTWQSGYDYTTSMGTYIMQNNEIKFTPLWIEDGLECRVEEILPIKMAENKLGEWRRVDYEEDEDMGGYGCFTKKAFKASGKAMEQWLEEQNRQKAAAVKGLDWLYGVWEYEDFDYNTMESYMRKIVITPTYTKVGEYGDKEEYVIKKDKDDDGKVCYCLVDKKYLADYQGSWYEGSWIYYHEKEQKVYTFIGNAANRSSVECKKISASY